MTGKETLEEMMERKAKIEEKYFQVYWVLVDRPGPVTEEDEDFLTKLWIENAEIEEDLQERLEAAKRLGEWQGAKQLSFSFQWECKINPNEVPF